jgi:hypothetical protein
MWSNFFVINYLMRREVGQRVGYPLGDEADTTPLLEAAHAEPLHPAADAAGSLPAGRPG